MELVERENPLEVIDNPDPHVRSMIIGELTPFEKIIYDDVLHSGLGTEFNRADTPKPVHSTSHTVTIVMYLSDIKSSDHNHPAAIYNCPTAMTILYGWNSFISV